MKLSIQIIAATYIVAAFGTSATASVIETKALKLIQPSSSIQSASPAALEQLRIEESRMIARKKLPYSKVTYIKNCFTKCTTLSCMSECGSTKASLKSISENQDNEIISTKTVRDVFEELQTEMSDLKS
jgi:hypothetical protein